MKTKRRGRPSAGGHGPGGHWLQSHPTSNPTSARPLVPEELADALKRPLLARFLSRVPGDSGSPVPKTYPHPLRTFRALQSRPVMERGGRRGAGVPWPLRPSRPASRRAPQWRGHGLPGCGHAHPGPGALLPGARTGCSQCRPGLGVGPGEEAGSGRPRVSGCSGNGDVPRHGRGQHAGCIF